MFGWKARAVRDSAAAANVDGWREWASRCDQTVCAVFVTEVYQEVRRGTKALVRLDGTPWERDAFFWWTGVQPGSMLVVSLSTGWGPHTQRDDVLWVGGRDFPSGTGIHVVIPSRDLKRWARYHRRRQASTPPTPVI